MRNTSSRSAERGQGLIEVAIVLPVILFLMLGLMSMAWTLFQYETLAHIAQRVANAALVSNEVDFPQEISTTNPRCELPADKYILSAAQSATLITKIAPGSLCAGALGAPFGGRCDNAPANNRTDWLFLRPKPPANSTDINICIHMVPTVYAPGCVTASVSTTVTPLAGFPFFRARVTQTSTTGSGVGCT